MNVIVEQLTDFKLVRDLARATVSKGELTSEVSEEFKRNILIAEHSPIRALMFKVVLTDIPYYVSVHLSRHKHGVEHFVSTQRVDRTGEDRDSKPQDSPVNHIMIINAQALINMSRKRLCYQASGQTIKLMNMIRQEVKNLEPLLGTVMVKECMYRGVCPEINSCSYYENGDFNSQDLVYLELLGVNHE